MNFFGVNLLDVDKPGIFINGKQFKGRISHWQKVQSTEPYSLGWYVIGFFRDHPVFKNKCGHTSDAVASYPTPKGELIETRNSVYLLMDKVSWAGWGKDDESPLVQKRD
jgi:hypothetical protein